MDPQQQMYAVVKIATEDLTDLELATLNNCAQLDYDPRPLPIYDKIEHLFDGVDRQGRPRMHDLTKGALAQVVLQRLA
jgi:hypothetical protein